TRFQQMKLSVAEKTVQRVPQTVIYAEDYATGALDVRNTIVQRMRQLNRLEFEQLLRPAFRQDEWKLIAVGAVIGGLVGELQVLLMLHGSRHPPSARAGGLGFSRALGGPAEHSAGGGCTRPGHPRADRRAAVQATAF